MLHVTGKMNPVIPGVLECISIYIPRLLDANLRCTNTKSDEIKALKPFFQHDCFSLISGEIVVGLLICGRKWIVWEFSCLNKISYS